MELQVWQWVLGAVGTLGAAGLIYLGGRYTARSAASATTVERDAVWNARYRAGAEKHIQWDTMVMTRLQRVELKVGIDEPIPPPPPLFPDMNT